MTAFYFQLGIAAAGHGNTVLLLENGRCRLHCRTKYHRHAAGNAAQNAAVVVGFCPDGSILIDKKRIVVLTAPQRRTGESVAKLDGRNAENSLRNPALHAVKHVVAAASCRQTFHHAFDNAAHRVAFRLGLGHGLHHGFQSRFVHPVNPGHRIHGCRSADTAYRNHLCRHRDAPPFQNLLGHTAGSAERCRQSSGKMAAAPQVHAGSVPHHGCEIRMTRPRHVFQIVIVPGFLIGVFNHHADRRIEDLIFLSAAVRICSRLLRGLFQHAAEEHRNVRFLPRRGIFFSNCGPPGHEGQQLVHIYDFPCRKALCHHADGFAVGFPVDGYFQFFSVCASHNNSLSLKNPG